MLLTVYHLVDERGTRVVPGHVAKRLVQRPSNVYPCENAKCCMKSGHFYRETEFSAHEVSHFSLIHNCRGQS
jgi:hypothetical protein